LPISYRRRHAAGRQMMIQIASTDIHGILYPGGAFSLASALFWAVRSRQPKRRGRIRRRCNAVSTAFR
jgi:hypothetical protein